MDEEKGDGEMHDQVQCEVDGDVILSEEGQDQIHQTHGADEV